jgi:hypothetical protein
MNRQQQIDQFLLSAHKLALSRLREHPERLQDVAALLARWRRQEGESRSDAYWDEWGQLLADGIDAIERETCAESDHAAVLRSVSPMSVLISQRERSELLRQTRQTP